MKANGPANLVLLLFTIAIHLHAQQAEADRKLFDETKTQAEKGDAPAQYNLAILFDNGRGVTKDEGEAVKWYRKAADQGFARAQASLGLGYYLGDGVIKDETSLGPCEP